MWKESSSCQGQEKGRNRQIANGCGVSFGDNNNIIQFDNGGGGTTL
jgi:hypothetical protein